jgi:hypothetical protein
MNNHVDKKEDMPGLLLVMHDIPTELDGAMNHWYHHEHIAERLAVPGMVSARRYQAIESRPAYMIVYKCESIDTLLSDEYRRVLDNPTETTRKILPRMENVIRAVCRETWSVGSHVGATAVVVQCKAVEGRKEDARKFIRETLARRLHDSGDMVSISLWESDLEATDVTNSDTTRRTAPDHYADWVLLVEGYNRASLSLALHREALLCDGQRDDLLLGAMMRYELMCIYNSHNIASPVTGRSR